MAAYLMGMGVGIAIGLVSASTAGVLAYLVAWERGYEQGWRNRSKWMRANSIRKYVQRSLG